MAAVGYGRVGYQVVEANADGVRVTDIVDQNTRSRMMSGIRSKHTRLERVVRSGLHRLGFRFRLHVRALPGTPDLVLPRYRAAVFVSGCFWHGHDCELFRWPGTRREFWRKKIGANRHRDARNLGSCRREGWRVLVVRECAMRGSAARPVETVVSEIAGWLRSESTWGEIAGGSPYGDAGPRAQTCEKA